MIQVDTENYEEEFEEKSKDVKWEITQSDYDNEFDESQPNTKTIEDSKPLDPNEVKESTNDKNEKDDDQDEKKDDGEEEKEGPQGEDDLINDEEMIDIAEASLLKISEAMGWMNQNVHSIYAPYIITEVIEGHQIQLLSPLHFLEGLKNLQILDFTELEIACVMNVLAKPQLDNAILVDELVQIMQNFGVMAFPHQ